MSPDLGRSAARRLAATPQQILGRAQDLGQAGYAAFATFALADVYRLGASDAESAACLARAREMYRALGDRCGEALCSLLEGDALVTPRSSPEVLGFDLEALGEPRSVPAVQDAERARRCYETARDLFRTAGAPRGVASAELRDAYLDLLAGDAAGAGRRLEDAERQFNQAGDGAGAQLARVHATLAAIGVGRLSAARPGPTDGVARWAETVGSRSYAWGLGRLVHAAGLAWRREAQVERARVALGLAVDLSQRCGGPYEQQAVAYDFADFFASLNSRGPAIATFEVALADGFRPAGVREGKEPIEPVRWQEIATLVAALYREHAAERDADGIERVAAATSALLDRAPLPEPRPQGDWLADQQRARRELARLAGERLTAAPGGGHRADFERRSVALTAGTLARQVRVAGVMVPLYRARRARDHGDESVAGRMFADALAASRRMGEAGRTLEIITLLTMGRFEEGRERLRAYIAGSPDVDPDDVVDLCLSAGDYAGAASRLGPDDGPVGPPGRDWQAPARRAAIAAGIGDRDVAERMGGVAAERFERWFSSLGRDAFKVSVTDDGLASRLYVTMSRVVLASGRPAESLVWGDRLRSLALGELVRRTSAAKQAGGAVPAVLAWEQASAEWTGAYDLLAAASREAMPDRVRGAQERLDACQRRLEAAEARLEADAPAMLVDRARDRYSSRLDPDAVRSVLPAGTLLVEYLVDDGHLLVWTMDGDGVEGSDTEIETGVLTGRARRFHSACSGRATPSVDDGRALADLLLGPIAGRLAAARAVVVVPAGPLSLLPFHLLPIGDEPLCATHTVSYLPSASLLPYVAGSARLRLEGDALVVGDPAFGPGRALRRLAGAGVEARLVASRLRTTALTDARATGAAVRNGVAGRRVIHLATHGLLSAVAPTTSALALAGTDQLTVADLMGLPLDADLVVLSACDTGRGDATLGGDVVGLARGLLAAGARGVVVSLWPVDDEAGCVMMDRFYERLVAGATTAQALAAAQLDVRGLDAAGIKAAFRALADVAAHGSGPRSRDMVVDDAPEAPSGHRAGGHRSSTSASDPPTSTVGEPRSARLSCRAGQPVSARYTTSHRQCPSRPGESFSHPATSA